MDKKELEQIAGMLEQASERVAEFSKETYSASFQKYVQDNAHIWRMLADIWEGNDTLREKNGAEVAQCLAAAAQEQLDAAKGRAKKENIRLNINLYMVSYFFPAMIAYQRRCGGREEEMYRLTAVISDKWEECFGQRIQAADYESVQSGFKHKLCFVTTAVCQGLKKPQDCRELTLMKRYRDEYLLHIEEGDTLIREYYDIAPTIVKRIAREASPGEKYLYLWDTYISKCVSFVENNENEKCRNLYEAMIEELKEEYTVTDRHKQ